MEKVIGYVSENEMFPCQGKLRKGERSYRADKVQQSHLVKVLLYSYNLFPIEKTEHYSLEWVSCFQLNLRAILTVSMVWNTGETGDICRHVRWDLHGSGG